MGTYTAVNVIQANRNPDATDTTGSHAARVICGQLVRGIHIDIIGFKLAFGHQSRSLAAGVVDAHIGCQTCTNPHCQTGGNQSFLPVVLILGQNGNIFPICAALGLQVAAIHLGLYGGSIIHNSHTGTGGHGSQTSGQTCPYILRVAIAKMLCLNLSRAVKDCVHVIHKRTDCIVILMTHDTVAGGNSHFAAASRRR